MQEVEDSFHSWALGTVHSQQLLLFDLEPDPLFLRALPLHAFAVPCPCPVIAGHWTLVVLLRVPRLRLQPALPTQERRDAEVKAKDHYDGVRDSACRASSHAACLLFRSL